MRTTMSFASRRELLAKVAPRYREATRKQKTVILNEFISSTGYKRKYAIRLLSLPEIPTVRAIKRPRARFYGEAVQEALKIAWCASNYIASKRLSPFLAELVPVLERHSHLELNDKVRHQLISISPATIDQILKPWRSRSGRGTTKRGFLLKHQVPVRTFADWEEKRPGFFEADLVTPFFPFPTYYGSEFINADLKAYCEREEITFTRGRAYKKTTSVMLNKKMVLLCGN